MARFSGPQYPGAGRADRDRKRAEAEERDGLTLPQNRAGYWRSDDTGLAVVPGDGACRWPWKDGYENSARAGAALRGMDDHRKRQGLHPYPCPAGHWHLGRLVRRSPLAWRAA